MTLRHGSLTPRSRGVATGSMSTARPNSRAAIADDLAPSAKHMRDLQDGDRSRLPRQLGTPCTGVKTCSRHDAHPRIEVVVGESADRVQAARPAVVVEFVHRELAGVHVDARPRRIGQRVAIANPKPKFRAVIGAAADNLDRLLEIAWHSMRIRTAGAGRWESWPTSSTSAHRPLQAGAPSCPRVRLAR